MSNRSTDELRARLLDAFSDLSSERGLHRVTVSELAARADVSRSYSYRVFRHGISSIIDDLHQELVRKTLDQIRLDISLLPRPVDFVDAVIAGVGAAFDVISQHCLTTKVFRGDRKLVGDYLRNEDDGTIVAVLGDYAANCAALYGSTSPLLTPVCRSFVADIVTAFIREVEIDAVGEFTWPKLSEPVFAAGVRALVEALVRRLEIQSSEFDRSVTRLPRAIAIPDMPAAFPARVAGV